MLIVFDHGTPRSIAGWLEGHTVVDRVMLDNSQRPAVDRYIDRVIASVNAATPGSFAEVEIPYD